ncbi:MAG: hypothetical protein AVDCRST_MAG88-2363, partial [uncultured Thermomicrobiales bacterium]
CHPRRPPCRRSSAPCCAGTRPRWRSRCSALPARSSAH